MSKIYSLFILIALSSSTIVAQNSYKWAHGFVTNSYINTFKERSMALESNGDVYTTGSFVGTQDFDPGVGVSNLISAGIDDIYLTKYDLNGNFIWGKSIGGAGFDYGDVLGVDNSGNIILAGVVSGTVDFDFGPSTTTLTDANFVAKYTSSGDFLWVTQLNYRANSIQIGTNGTAFLIGANYFTKIDASGALVWENNIIGMTGKSIAVDGVNNVSIVGSFSSSIDLDPSAGTATLNCSGSKDGFLASYDASGNYLWSIQLGGNSTFYGGADETSSVDIDASGNIFVTGVFSETIDFDPGPGTVNITANLVQAKRALYLAKYDPNGNYIFAFRFLNETNVSLDGPALTLDNNSNVFIT